MGYWRIFFARVFIHLVRMITCVEHDPYTTKPTTTSHGEVWVLAHILCTAYIGPPGLAWKLVAWVHHQLGIAATKKYLMVYHVAGFSAEQPS